ncbi:MAG: hypothetical protein HYR55_09190 [Acidobacteria bacterium]|nr:hypothetical protein [Acidobacteriota bacterium]MBI3656657.1 hypothetical protein [Acidobacteriota bacterium]
MNKTNHSIGTLAPVLFVLLAFCSTAMLGQPYHFAVKHAHGWRSCQGELTISQEGITYQDSKEKHDRKWVFKEVQQVRLLSSKELAIVTYEDQRLKWSGDRSFRFILLDGEITNSLYRFLLEKTGKPLVAKIAFIETGPTYQLSAKHLHRWGGCQGTLIFSENGVIYQTDDKEESRTWLYSDLESIGPMNPFHLRLTTNETSRFHYGGRADFNFVLKEKMNEKLYEYLWRHIHKMESPSNGISSK